MKEKFVSYEDIVDLRKSVLSSIEWHEDVLARLEKMQIYIHLVYGTQANPFMLIDNLKAFLEMIDQTLSQLEAGRIQIPEMQEALNSH